MIRRTLNKYYRITKLQHVRAVQMRKLGPGVKGFAKSYGQLVAKL